MGEDLHIAVWPGSKRNTNDITRFNAKESRSFVVSVSGLMKINDFPTATPYRESIVKEAPEALTDGGSCISGPDVTQLIVKRGVNLLSHLKMKMIRENENPLSDRFNDEANPQSVLDNQRLPLSW